MADIATDTPKRAQSERSKFLRRLLKRKTVAAGLIVLTIFVLGTGVYLWLRRRKAGVSVERAIAQGSVANSPLLSG